MDKPKEQIEFESLDAEYQPYIKKLRADWLFENKAPEFKEVYEVLHPDDRAKVDQHIVNCQNYIVPFAEAWWGERGYGVVWPDDDSKPMQLYKLESV